MSLFALVWFVCSTIGVQGGEVVALGSGKFVWPCSLSCGGISANMPAPSVHSDAGELYRACQQLRNCVCAVSDIGVLSCRVCCIVSDLQGSE